MRTVWAWVLLASPWVGVYAVSAAPSLLWGDDAELQRIAITGEQRVIGQSSVASHLLWQTVAMAFVRLTPWLPVDAAGRVTLVSVIAASLAVLPLWFATRDLARRVGLSEAMQTIASAVAVTSFGLSHTFWLLASRPDAYTLQTLLLATALWAGVRAGEASRPVVWWGVVVGVVGVALTNHVMILASVPGLALLAGSRVDFNRTAMFRAGLVVATLGGLAIGAYAVGFPLTPLVAIVWNYRPLLPRPIDLAGWVAFLVYQFPGSLAFVWVAVLLLRRSGWRLAGAFSALYIGPVILVLFPALYIRDQYIFYLPSYLPIAILIGLGAGQLVDSPPAWFPGTRRARLVAITGVVLAPLIVYPVATVVAGGVASRLAPSRVLPGRDPVTYYLWPPKAGYSGARDYVSAAFAILPTGAVVVADWLPYQAMRYVQTVEGSRPDITLEMINAGNGRQLAYLLAQAPETPLYLADVSPPPYYEIAEIRTCFVVQAEGVVFRLHSNGCTQRG